ncbi:hypothetical protein [Planctomicrobium sp. SH664]|uniref:hypothetical protein n=1 Tax=Planctomicrobium sp. SH664 TaxID=3448125 RepID=UPI003F5BDBB5
MSRSSSDPTTLDELHTYIHRTLCDAENLLSDQFVTRVSPLFSQGKPCGLEYSLQGLRSVRLTAIWAADPNVVYFYDARGERFQKVKLKHRLPLPETPTAAAG